ncbi:rod-determining factor RdfA [Halorhabdus amylolytica]|uniref:rod-determining factor RdfA n=1 Tax=Halorhabdus amylolytica TaxID=2559573 RepID=UPI0010A9ED31|nr:rod-determining factor RdfA [Halorhabdus amylolytica]
MADTDSNTGGRPNKVRQLIDRHELADIGDELVAGWTAEGDDHRSLRDLADAFNRALLEHRLSEADPVLTRIDVENAYRLLTSADASPGERTELRSTLENNGVDVASLRGDFVTYQSVRNYLQDVRGVEYDDHRESDPASSLEHIRKLQTRLTTVTESKVENLRQNGSLEGGDLRVTNDIRVYCHDCRNQYTIDEFFENEGCECADTAEVPE